MIRFCTNALQCSHCKIKISVELVGHLSYFDTANFNQGVSEQFFTDKKNCNLHAINNPKAKLNLKFPHCFIRFREFYWVFFLSKNRNFFVRKWLKVHLRSGSWKIERENWKLHSEKKKKTFIRTFASWYVSDCQKPRGNKFWAFR